MSTELLQWMVPLFFLGALVLVSRLERQISSVNRHSYRQIAGGLSLLAVVSLAALYRELGMFGHMPFLSEALFFDLVNWTFAITGSIFVLSGVSYWLPLARKQREVSQSVIKKLGLLKRLEQLLGVETRLDQILTTSVDYMVDHFSMNCGAVYKYDSEKKQLCYLAGTYQTPSAVKQYCPSSERLEQYAAGHRINLSRLLADLPEGVAAPASVLPLIAERRPVGLFVLWGGEKTESSSEDELTLRLAIAAIARKVSTDLLAREYESGSQKQAWKQRLEIIVGGARTAREAFSPFVQGLGQRVPVDFAALAILSEEAGRMRRLSLGPGGRVLVESDLPIPSTAALTSEAYREGEMVIENDLSSGREISFGEIVTDGQVRSLVAFPVLREGRSTAVLTLAACQAEAYRAWELRDLEAVLPVLDRLVCDDLARREIRRRDRRLTRLSRLVRETSVVDEMNQTFAATADLISEETGADIVRISTPNTEGAFLKSRTLVLSRSFETIVPANGELIVSLMPVHEQVLNNGQAMLSGSRRTGTSLVEFERQQVFAAGVKSAMMVPVSVAGEVAAIISIASMHESRELHRDSGALSFVESAARCLAASIQRLRAAAPVPSKELTWADRDIVAGVSEAIERRWTAVFDGDDEMISRYRAAIARHPNRPSDLELQPG